MKIQYFEETDTALIDFSTKAIFETTQISENVFLDFDEEGNLVSMTLEHAKEKRILKKLEYEEIKSA